MFTVLKKQIIANPLLILLAALTLSPVLEDRLIARACWNDVLSECFDRSLLTFPWENPTGSQRRWRRNPSPPFISWGIQDRMYSVDFGGMCNNDIQAAWCMGGTRTFDPDVDPYPPNLGDYVTYGPFDLTNAVDAVIQFQLLCESEHLGDSIVWGVADSPNLTADNIMIDSAFSGSTLAQAGVAWKWVTSHLGNLRDINGNPVSALGTNPVYAFWWFTADADPVDQPPAHQLDNGAFIDNILIKWDDGGIDYRAGTMGMRNEDSSYVVNDPIVGDIVRTSFIWVTCAGGIETFPDVRITVTVTNPFGFDNIIYDEIQTNVSQDSIHSVITDPWSFDIDGEHIIKLAIDPDDLIDETRENNNRDSITAYVWPPNPHPEFTWLNPGTDTLFTPDTARLKWEAFDLGEAATISIYIDNNDNGCFGQSAPGGLNLTENDGPDSLAWSVTNLLPNTVRWPFARVSDASNWDTCIYTPFPVVRVLPDAATELPIGVPGEFFLAQNYPNPFNPETEITYGVTRAGLVTLRVYDVLGRQVAELVNQELSPGTYLTRFNGRDLSSGVYIYTLSSPEGVRNHKMVLMK